MAPSQALCGLALKKKFLGVLAPLCDGQQIVETVSAATLEPTHPARPYHRAPRGVHFHALRANFPCVFALSLYECEDHARSTPSRNSTTCRCAPPSCSAKKTACLACSRPRPLWSGLTLCGMYGTQSGFVWPGEGGLPLHIVDMDKLREGVRFTRFRRDLRELRDHKISKSETWR